ncbi:hypothetical protein L195_g016492, partial [Trifolium pratense]
EASIIDPAYAAIAVMPDPGVWEYTKSEL